jgi:hypothetical protein
MKWVCVALFTAWVTIVGIALSVHSEMIAALRTEVESLRNKHELLADALDMLYVAENTIVQRDKYIKQNVFIASGITGADITALEMDQEA